MRVPSMLISAAAVLLFGQAAICQMTPWLYWTLLPAEQRDLIVGEASGETAWNTIMETGGYNKNRRAEEYRGTFYESPLLRRQSRSGIP